MGPAYELRDGALAWLAEGDPRWRQRDGRPHLTNLAFAADLSPSMLSKLTRREQPLTTKVQAHLVALAMAVGFTEEQARAHLFKFVATPDITRPVVAA